MFNTGGSYMNENKKMICLSAVLGFIVLFIVIGSILDGSSDKKYLKNFYDAFYGSENRLVMIGRDNCSWCQLFKPTLDFMKDYYEFDYVYVNTNELNSSNFKKLLSDINVSESSFGTPLTLVVKDGRVVDSKSGYVDETELFTFLVDNGFVSKDEKLVLNYLDYSHYKKLLKSSDKSIVVIGQTSCSYCIKAKPILNEVSRDKNVKINFLNITDLSEDDAKKFSESLDYLKENQWGTPLTLIIENGKVIDSANGLLDYNGYVKLFEDNGLIK